VHLNPENTKEALCCIDYVPMMKNEDQSLTFIWPAGTIPASAWNRAVHYLSLAKFSKKYWKVCLLTTAYHPSCGYSGEVAVKVVCGALWSSSSHTSCSYIANFIKFVHKFKKQWSKPSRKK